MTALELSGNILFLSCDPKHIEAQLKGYRSSMADVEKLRDDISTDELTPVPKLTYFDDRLASYIYTGLKVGGVLPIGKDAIRNNHFCATVAGRRYGKGSSREHSPLAEKLAGIKLVIAESFERIYRQNADNIGLFTSTDFTLIDRILKGSPIYIEELVKGRDKLAASILLSGGLLAYGQRKMARMPESAQKNDSESAQTYAEKILSRHRITTEDTTGPIAEGAGLFVSADWRFIIEMYTGMARHLLRTTFGTLPPLHEPQSIIAFEDHLSYAKRSPAYLSGIMVGIEELSSAHREFVEHYELRSHGYLPNEEGSEGICHPMMTEKYALPGQIVVGTDSHTPHSGSIGCIAFGVGTTDMANAFVTGAVRLTVPSSLRIVLNGAVPEGITAKDIVLHLLSTPDIRSGIGVGKIFEFTGSAIANLTTDERATLTNMAAELGGFTGIISPDEETVRFLKERRNIDFELETWMCSDPGAHYAATITINCETLTPMVAAPGDPGNGVPLSNISDHIKIDIAYGGSCTGGKRADFDGYHRVLSWAAENGLSVPEGVTLYLQFGTSNVRDYCIEQGYLKAFRDVGANILQPSCGACANLGPGGSTRADQVTVSAQNRNFPGRSGPGLLWIASPPTVAASAIAGELMSFEDLRRKHSK